jgi:hypothetical protein
MGRRQSASVFLSESIAPWRSAICTKPWQRNALDRIDRHGLKILIISGPALPGFMIAMQPIRRRRQRWSDGPIICAGSWVGSLQKAAKVIHPPDSFTRCEAG